MKTETVIETPKRCCDYAKVAIYSVAILCVLLIGYMMIHAMRRYARSPQVTANRAAERAAARAEIMQKSQAELHGDYVVLNKNNGVVRLPIDRAMEMVIQGGQNPAGFRSNLLARVESATKPPPKPPEKKSDFE